MSEAEPTRASRCAAVLGLALASGLTACAASVDRLPLVQRSEAQQLTVVNGTRMPITVVPATGSNIQLAPDAKLTLEVVVESRKDNDIIRNFIRESAATRVLADDVLGPEIFYRDPNGNVYILTLGAKGCPIPWETKPRATENHTVKLTALVPLRMDVCPSM